MSEDDFTKLFKYMDKRFDEVEQQLEKTATKKDLNKLIQIMDGYAAKVDAYA